MEYRPDEEIILLAIITIGTTALVVALVVLALKEGQMKITKADVGRTVKLRDGATAVITDVRPSYMHRCPAIVRRESDGYVMEVGENGRLHSLEENEDIIEFLPRGQPRDEQPPASDNVNHPPHYTSHPSGIECIQVTEHMPFNLGNAVKYIWRHEGKNGAEDLRKAIWYLEREIQRTTPLRRELNEAPEE